MGSLADNRHKVQGTRSRVFERAGADLAEIRGTIWRQARERRLLPLLQACQPPPLVSS
jgi:hypothetical protein